MKTEISKINYFIIYPEPFLTKLFEILKICTKKLLQQQSERKLSLVSA